MLRITNLVGFGGGGPRAYVELAGLGKLSAEVPSVTISGVPYGAEHPNRTIFVSVVASQPGTTAITWDSASAQIGGSAATTLVSQAIDGSNQIITAIMARAVPTGTTGSIKVAYSGGSATEHDFAVYRAIRVSSLTPTDTGVGTNNPGTVLALDLNTAANGFLIGCAGSYGSTSYSWTGATETQDRDFNSITRGHAFVAQTRPGATPLTLTATAADSQIQAGCAASLAFT